MEKRPYDNCRTCRGSGSIVCSSNERWESAGLSVNTSFSQESPVCLKLPFGGIFPFSPCLPTPIFYRPSGFAVVKRGCKALEGNWAPRSGSVPAARSQAPEGGGMESLQSPMCFGFPEPVPLDGNVVLLQLGLPFSFL